MSSSQPAGQTVESSGGGSESSPDLLGSVPIRTEPFSSGEIIADKYEVRRVIGEGGVAIVIAAQHVELGRLVAIKLLKPEMRERPELVRRFAREAKASVRIESEYAVRVYDVGVAKGRGPYLVMEYLEGQDLGARLVEYGRLPVTKAVEYTMQACEALAVAHANGIIHRDIKPENLFLAKRADETEVLKVLDFGISKSALTGSVFGISDNLVQTQEVMGTPLYMSPEQIRSSAEVDCRTDIWSLGVVLYELLTGELAFDGEAITTICADVLERDPIPISRLVPDVPDVLQAIVTRCLEKDRSYRFESVGELAMALMQFGPRSARDIAKRTTGILSATARSERRLSSPEFSSTVRTQRRAASGVRVGSKEAARPNSSPRSAAFRTLPAIVPERAAVATPIAASPAMLHGAMPFLFAGALVAGGLVVALLVLALDRQSEGKNRSAVVASSDTPALRGAKRLPPQVPATAPPPTASSLPAPSATPGPVAVERERPQSGNPSWATAPTSAPPGPVPQLGGRAAPLAGATAPTPATSQPDCTPPFYFEGTKKIFKPGCL